GRRPAQQLAIADVPASVRLLGGGDVLGLAQVLAKARDGLVQAAVLLEAAALVVDVVGISGGHVELGQELEAALEVAREALGLRFVLARIGSARWIRP